MKRAFSFSLICLLTLSGMGWCEDWTQFRGKDGAGLSSDTKVPLRWSDTENLLWKSELPGQGSSSPIVFGDRVFVTCYSGYGVAGSNNPIQSLERHLLCFDRTTGKLQWDQKVPADLPEDGYQGYISEHGYASSTPVTDGERVYCFFGKSGVFAFDLDGNQLWKVAVGKESSNRRWGSAASLILHKDSVIVNASEESQSIRALDKRTGKEIWKAEGSAMELAYGTPSLLTFQPNQLDLVLAIPGEVWGLNPDTGKIRWFAEHQLTGNICPSVFGNDGSLYIFGGFRSAGSLALRLNGEKSKPKAEVAWTSKNSSYVATPVLHEGHLYWIDNKGLAYCSNAKTGELVYRERVNEIVASGQPVYASPVIANGRIYVPSRWSGVMVLAAEPKYQVLAHNRLSSDESDFSGTPAISNGAMFLRSNRFLYCVADRK